jgi:hypothetical protein
MTTQEAFDHAGGMLNKCYRDWFLAQADLPCSGEVIDRAVQKYIDALQATTAANLYWQ